MATAKQSTPSLASSLQNLMQLSSLQNIRHGMKAEQKRVAAEDQMVARMMGAKLDTKEDEMGDIINMAPVTHNHTQTGGGFARLAGQALLAGAIGGPLAWLGHSYINRPQPALAPVVDTDTDTVTELKILRD